MSTPAPNAPQGKRFKVALSFPGEHRDYIKQVAEHLVNALGESAVFYDKNFEHELARPRLVTYLMDIYKDQSDLNVVFLCREYTEKEWCGIEFDVVMEMIKAKREESIMPVRFDDAEIKGFLSIHGYLDIGGRDAKIIAELIIKRLESNGIDITSTSMAIAKLTPTETVNMVQKQDITIETLQRLEMRINEMQLSKDNNPALESQIQKLTKEKEELKQQLLQTKEILEKQEKEGKELIKLLEADKEKSELKQKALEAVEAKNYDEAENLLKESAAERIKQVASDFYELGKIKKLKLEYYEALRYFELAVQVAPDNSLYCNAAGDLCWELGYLDKGLKYHEKSLELDTKDFGEESEDVATDYNELGLIWNEKGNWDKAIEHYEKSLKIYLNLFGEDHEYTAACYNNLGEAWRMKGE